MRAWSRLSVIPTILFSYRTRYAIWGAVVFLICGRLLVDVFTQLTWESWPVDCVGPGRRDYNDCALRFEIHEDHTKIHYDTLSCICYIVEYFY